MIDLEAVKARCAKATAGPWRSGVDALECSKCNEDVGLGASVVADKATDVCFTYANPVENADFIAHARTDLPALVAEVERLRKVEAAAKYVVRELGGCDVKYNGIDDLSAALDAAQGGG